MTQVTEGSTDDAAAAVAMAAMGGGQPSNRKSLTDLLKLNTAEFGHALPRGTMDPERFIRIVMTEFRKTPQLLLTTPESFMGALMQTAQLGLEPGGQLGHVYLIPYKNNKLSKQRGEDVYECQLQIGYKGFIELGGRRGILLKAREVEEHDEFDFDLGSDEYLHHKWKLGQDRGPVIGLWGKVVMPDGKTSFIVMDLDEINERRDRSSAVQAAKRHEWMKTPWDTDYNAMARKTVIRAMVPQVPLAPELQIALKADEAVIEERAGELAYLYRDAIDIGPDGAAEAGDAATPTTVQEVLTTIETREARDEALAALKEAFGPGYEDTDPEVIGWLQGWLDGDQDAAADARGQTPAEAPQDTLEPPAAGDGDPGPTEPGEAPTGVPQDVLDDTVRKIDAWPVETVKQKLSEWGESTRGTNEKALRLKLVTKLATERARGNAAAEALF